MSKKFGICGRKNSGKTTLVSRLVTEFTKRGYSVSTVKHAHHSFSIDHEGTDSYAHRQAGAKEVALVSSERWAIMHEVHSQGAIPSLDTMLAKLAPCDLVLVEGYKNVSSLPKIECIRQSSAKEPPLWRDNQSIIALASEQVESDFTNAQFELNDVAKIADHITQSIGLTL